MDDLRLAACIRGRGITLIRRVYEGAPAGCINLGLGQPIDPVPEAALAAAHAALDGRVVAYSPTAGLPELREALARKVYGDDDAASVMVTSGSQEALWVTLMGLVDRGEDVLFAEPGYPAYRAVTEMIGARAVAVPARFETGWRLEPEAVAERWTDATRALIVGSPANPTGMFAQDQAGMERLYRLCEERGAWFVADEIYAPIRFAEPHGALHALGERVVAIGGMSKAFSATGLRIGWIHAHPDVVSGLMPLHQQVALCAPTIGQRAALACLQEWGAPLEKALRTRYEPRRRAMMEALERAGLRYREPEGAFYVFVDVRDRASDTLALALRLRDEALVITAPGESFGKAGAGHLRLSFVSDPEQIREGVGRIASVLEQVRR